MAIEMSIGWILVTLNVKIAVAQTSSYINGFNAQTVGSLNLGESNSNGSQNCDPDQQIQQDLGSCEKGKFSGLSTESEILCVGVGGGGQPLLF